MVENTTTFLNQNKLLQNLAIISAVIAAVAIFVLTINSLGLFRPDPHPDLAPTPGGAVVQTEGFKFLQQSVHISAGKEVKLQLSNADILPHSFDVDDLNLHIAMPSKDTAETTLTITQPGTYTFYCAIPGHREAGMAGTLIVEP